MSFPKSSINAILAAGLLYGTAPLVEATPILLGLNGWDESILYDVDPATGVAFNPRTTGLDRLVGIKSPQTELWELEKDYREEKISLSEYSERRKELEAIIEEEEQWKEELERGLVGYITHRHKAFLFALDERVIAHKRGT